MRECWPHSNQIRGTSGFFSTWTSFGLWRFGEHLARKRTDQIRLAWAGLGYSRKFDSLGILAGSCPFENTSTDTYIALV